MSYNFNISNNRPYHSNEQIQHHDVCDEHIEGSDDGDQPSYGGAMLVPPQAFRGVSTVRGTRFCRIQTGNFLACIA